MALEDLGNPATNDNAGVDDDGCVKIIITMMTISMTIMMMMMIRMMMGVPVEHCLHLGLWQNGGVALLKRLLIVVHLGHCDYDNNGYDDDAVNNQNSNQWQR